MWGTIKEVARAVAEVFGLINKRTDLKNAPDVKQAAKANNENAEVERETQAIANKDVKAIRNNLSE